MFPAGPNSLMTESMRFGRAPENDDDEDASMLERSNVKTFSSNPDLINRSLKLPKYSSCIPEMKDHNHTFVLHPRTTPHFYLESR
jgi:hypothetical protein